VVNELRKGNFEQFFLKNNLGRLGFTEPHVVLMKFFEFFPTHPYTNLPMQVDIKKLFNSLQWKLQFWTVFH